MADAGPPPGVRERRTGWDRRIADRRTGGDRRSGLDRRDPTPAVLLRAVAVQTARQLVSRLYLQVTRSPKASARARERIAAARAELLTRRPDLERVGKALDDLKSTAAAKFPEYGLARELLRPLRGNHKGKAASKADTPALKRRDSLEQLRATLAAPLTPSVPSNGATRSRSASGNRKKKGKQKTPKQPARKKQASAKKRGRSAQ
ncbi:MAG: hypothetical protein JSW43_00240 [Gemmatimonadota bacterium]|nr:MAG: hypothetical protein JSW43_00240 [Gemmatimonadota bacterium]